MGIYVLRELSITVCCWPCPKGGAIKTVPELAYFRFYTPEPAS